MLAEISREKISDYIPLDKSWVIRMGVLDLIKGYSDITRFLESQQDLGGDLKALQRVIRGWNNLSEPLQVGESGTIYRFVKFYNWKNKIEREIQTSDTLVNRIKRGAICNNPDIINWGPKQLLELDSKTSQWATMAYLIGDRRQVANPPFKLQVTYDAVDSWEEARKSGNVWEARKDPTILNQAVAFTNYLRTGKIEFKPEQAEDYCFARAFDILTPEEGKILYPSLDGHETPRFEEMEKALEEAKAGIVSSEDHRVVQAVEMRYFLEDFSRANFVKPDCVNKTWPRFWEFVNYISSQL